MRCRTAFVYSAWTVDAIGRMCHNLWWTVQVLMARYFQE